MAKDNVYNSNEEVREVQQSQIWPYHHDGKEK